MPNLTDAELRLLSLLTWKTRAAADVQLASVVGITDSKRPAFVRRLKQLARRGFLSRHCVSIALLVPEAPLVNWLPDLPEADWQAVAWKLQHRWNELSATRVWINVATRQAASVVGGVGGRLRQPMQLQHDLAMTAVYLVRQAVCVPGEIWIGEDALSPVSTTQGPHQGARCLDRGP